MAKFNLDLAYDEDIFNYKWKNTPDVRLTNMIESGAMVIDGEIANLIANGSNFFTTPYYDVLGGDVQVYNGVTDFTYDTLKGGVYSGVVYGRMKAWDAISFIKDFNSGADPMEQIVNGVATYWINVRQRMLVELLETIFEVKGDTDFANHTTNIATATADVTEDNLMGITTLNDATVKSNGDHAQGYSLAIMHSSVANKLANLQLIEFSKYTDKSGLTRSLPIAHGNGFTIIVNDLVPTKDSATATGSKEYTTFVLGQGAIRYAQAPVDKPSEMSRNPEKNGGKDMIYTRVRECMAPYGFSFKGDVETDVGIPDEVLFKADNWERKMPSKSILMTRIISN